MLKRIGRIDWFPGRTWHGIELTHYRYVKLVVAHLDTYKALSDDAATGMLKEYLSIERARTDVKSEYVPRFGKVITAKKVARFFQVDNKLDAVINADMARLIPLAR